MPGLISAVLSATGTKERLDHFAELVTVVRNDPDAGDVELEGRAGDEAAARAAVLALARISVSGQPGGEAAAAAAKAARATAGTIPVSAYSLADLVDLAGGSTSSLADVLRAGT